MYLPQLRDRLLECCNGVMNRRPLTFRLFITGSITSMPASRFQGRGRQSITQISYGWTRHWSVHELGPEGEYIVPCIHQEEAVVVSLHLVDLLDDVTKRSSPIR